MPNNIRQNLFYYLSALYLIALGGAILLIPKADLHVLLCNRHTPVRDMLYTIYTHIGAVGPYITVLILIVLGCHRSGWRSRECSLAAMLLVSEWSGGAVVQILKYAVHADRPVEWFLNNLPEITLPLVEGQRIAYYNSFPSGHTCTCFILFTFLSILAGRIPHAAVRYTLQGLCFAAACLGAYSRVYLSMHFALDTWAGALLGIVVVSFWANIWPKLSTLLCKKP